MHFFTRFYIQCSNSDFFLEVGVIVLMHPHIHLEFSINGLNMIVVAIKLVSNQNGPSRSRISFLMTDWYSGHLLVNIWNFTEKQYFHFFYQIWSNKCFEMMFFPFLLLLAQFSWYFGDITVIYRRILCFFLVASITSIC